MTRHEEHDGAGAARQAEPTGAAIVGISVLATVVVLFVAEIAAICFAQEPSDQIAIQPGMGVLPTWHPEDPAGTTIPWTMPTPTKILVRLLCVVLALAMVWNIVSRKAAKQAEMTSATPVEAQLASSREATAAAVEARDAAKAAMATEKEELEAKLGAAKARIKKLETEKDRLEENVRAGKAVAAAVAVEKAATLCRTRQSDEYRNVSDTDLCHSAALNGHLELLQWARENGCPWNEQTCSRAAQKGHLKVLQWARENGCLWDADTCWRAAANGHLQVLQWARENGCPWNHWACFGAAANGHLELLQWARENGCPWDKDKCLKRAEALGRGTTVLEWIRQN